jgi:hypothetical protein
LCLLYFYYNFTWNCNTNTTNTIIKHEIVKQIQQTQSLNMKLIQIQQTQSSNMKLYYKNDHVCCICITISCLMIVFVVFVLQFHVSWLCLLFLHYSFVFNDCACKNNKHKHEIVKQTQQTQTWNCKTNTTNTIIQHEPVIQIQQTQSSNMKL